LKERSLRYHSARNIKYVWHIVLYMKTVPKLRSFKRVKK
jgi:hypothetical protein